MKTIAENANDFAEIRTADKGNCIYVDKTDYFHRLVTDGEKEGRVQEMNFERNLKILFWAFGYETVCEDRQTGGRADLVVMCLEGIFVFELKRDESADAALAQIREKGYAEPYRADGRPVYLIGLNFDSKTRQLVDAAAECL